MNAVLEAARTKRAKTQEKLDALLVKPTEETRSLSDEEAAKFEELASSIKGLDKQIRLLEKEEERKANAERAAAEHATAAQTLPAGEGTVRSPLTYDELAPSSYFYDLGMMALAAKEPTSYMGAGEAARARIIQHAKEVDIEARTNRDLARRLQEIRKTPEGLRAQIEQRVEPSTVSGFGGEMVPPLWLINQAIPLVRAGRPVANRVRNLPLPPGILTVNIPKMTVGTLTGPQTQNNAAVVSQDFTTTSVSAAVNTYAGQSDVAVQLLDLSPLQFGGGGMDAWIFDDLTRDYARTIDQAVLYGSGANGQHLGLFNVTGASAPVTNIQRAQQITVSNTNLILSATAGTSYNSIANAIQAIHTVRFDQATAIYVHPRRWYAWKTQTDTSNRPVVLDNPYQPWNAAGIDANAPQVQGVAGSLLGLPVVIDANIPTTFSGTATTGGTADGMLVLKEDDVFLFEGTLRARALPEVLSGTLSVRFQVWAYSAFLPTRFPPSIAQLTGNTGLAAPTF